jgi:Flp pilus assembly protein CpaB
MEAVQKRTPSVGLKKFLSSRRGAWTLAVASALLAGLVLLVFLNRYKESVNADVAPAPVLVADRLIPKGTSGSVVISEKLFRPAAVAEQDLKIGAVSDAVAMKGRVATREILPGQQITATDFADLADGIRSNIAQTQRAIQISINGAQGLAGNLRAGDRVDVLASPSAAPTAGQPAGRPEMGVMMRNVLVLASGTSDIIFQATDKQAAQLAFAATNGKLWLMLRPPVGAKDSKPFVITQESLLLRGTPVEVTTDGGGQP